MNTKWQMLATDFDGTIAHDSAVPARTLAGLARVREAGLAVLLVTGREMKDFPLIDFDLSVFDLVVAENGALLYDPKDRSMQQIAAPPPAEFAAALVKKGVPVSIGDVIVATVEPYEVAVLETIREMKLDLTVTFNKGAVMILPPNVNKATGISFAAEKLAIPLTAAIAVGDGENDHAFLGCCGLPVAVANAVPALKENARIVTQGARGAGMDELVDALLNGELEKY